MTHASGSPVKLSDLKSHDIVVVWTIRPGSGEERYVYKDADGWYFYGCAVVSPIRLAEMTEADGDTLKGVTWP